MSREDEDGNTYAVAGCSRMYVHGTEMPTFGGGVTNHVLHGFTRLWTAMMPPSLPEYVRTGGYRMAFDSEVTPIRRHFHLMVLPAEAEPFDSGRLAPGEGFSRTFDVAGTYRYFCVSHESEGMVGTVIVDP